MAWFAELAGKAESLLNNLDEQTGAALRNHNVVNKKHDKNDFTVKDSELTQAQKRRLPQRNFRKALPVPDTKHSPNSKPPPATNLQPRSCSKDITDTKTNKSKKSPIRSSLQHNLNHCPKTLVGDFKEKDVIDSFCTKQRRYSLPTELPLITSDEDWVYKMQNMEVENAMLKNELNVMNREVAELLNRLRKTEDEVRNTGAKLQATELEHQRIALEKETLASQVEQLKQKQDDLICLEMATYKKQNKTLHYELEVLKNKNKDLEEKCKEIHEKATERDAVRTKLDNDLRHAQSTIEDLQSNLEKATGECRRLEKDWEAYKLRVKNMLYAKDSELKSLQKGMDLSAETKKLMEEVESLRDERDELSEAVASVRTHCDNMKTSLQQMEARHTATERVVGALRDALREERAARNKADSQWISVAKQLKTLQIETDQTIASLRTTIHDKDEQINRLQETASTVCITDCVTSALNVADYDVMQDTIENNKIQHLTDMLVQRQATIDKLLGHNNMMKIQLEKLESKYKAELASIRASSSQSVIHLHEGDSRHRTRAHPATSSLSAFSVRLGIMVKRYPIIRIFIILYMVCLHFWVLTVLFTNTPEDFITRPSKS